MLKIFCVNCGCESLKLICGTCTKKLQETCCLRSHSIFFKDQQIEVHYFWEYDLVLKKLFKAAKYKFQKSLLISLAQIASKKLVYDFGKATVTYIPTTYLRYCFRGFNPSKVIAKTLFRGDLHKILSRTSFTRSQSQKNKKDRFNSVQNLFKIKNPTFKIAEELILVDDICTTGSTLCQAQKTILQNDPEVKIKIVVLAYTPKAMF